MWRQLSGASHSSSLLVDTILNFPTMLCSKYRVGWGRKCGLYNKLKIMAHIGAQCPQVVSLSHSQIPQMSPNIGRGNFEPTELKAAELN